MDIRDEEDKNKIEEYKKSPMTNFADSIDRSMIGDIGQLSKGSRLTRILSSAIIIGILFLLYKFS